MRESNVNEYGIKVGGRNISNLRYADDTALCTNNHEEATRFINELNKAGEEKSLKLNANNIYISGRQIVKIYLLMLTKLKESITSNI